MLEAGSQAPSFSLPSTSGGDVSLDALRGKKVILYFYPKDDTPGCTQEACDFRDSMARLAGRGAEVYGVSKDSIESHERFRRKFELPFALLTDDGSAIAKAYGAYGKKTLYGKEVEGTIRSTFLIDEQGRIERVWSPVRVEGHVDEVLEALGLERATTPATNGQVRGEPAAKPARAAKGRPAKAAGPARKGAVRASAGGAGAKAAARKPAPKKPSKKAVKKTAAKKASRKKAASTARRTPTRTIRPAKKPAGRAKAAAKKAAGNRSGAKKATAKKGAKKLARR